MVTPRVIAAGLGFTEGPVWTNDGRLLVTSISHGAIYEGDGTSRAPSPCTAACQGPAYGDVCLASVVNGAYVEAFVSAMFGGPTPDEVCHGDFDGSGDLNNGDVSGLVAALLGP